MDVKETVKSILAKRVDVSKLKEVRKELEVYRVALKLLCKDTVYNESYARNLREIYLKQAKKELNNEKIRQNKS